MAVKLAGGGAAAVAAAAAAAAVVGAGRGLAAAAAAAAIHISVSSQILKFFYSTNARQHAHLLGLKSRAQAPQPKTAAAWTAARTRSGG